MKFIIIALLLAGAAWGFTWEIDTENYKMTTDCYFCDGPCKGHPAPEAFKLMAPEPYAKIYFHELDAYADWEIKIYGAPGGFYVTYYGWKRIEISEEQREFIESHGYNLLGPGGYGADVRLYTFEVDSLNDIKPTPGEMEEK